MRAVGSRPKSEQAATEPWSGGRFLGPFNIHLDILTPRAITSAATAATATTALAATATAAVSAATGADTAGETLKALACANCRGRCARDLQDRTRLGAPEW
jgi:hypothetical protein